MTPEEKRKYPRLALRIEDGYFGNFSTANDQKIVAPIMNLSAGGLNMAVPDAAKDKIKAGDKLYLNNIAGGANLAFLGDVHAEIRWVKALDQPGYVSVGCQFCQLSDEVRQQLAQFVHTERMTRGQYD